VLKHPDYASPVTYDLHKLPFEDLRAGKAELVMRKGIVVEGSVTDPQGQPVANALVKQFFTKPGDDFGDPSLDSPSQTTDQQGRYQFPLGPSGHRVVVAAAPGYAPQSRRMTVTPDTRTVDFRLSPSELVRVRVVDEQGEPVAGVDVSTLIPARGIVEMFQATLPWADAQDPWMELSLAGELARRQSHPDQTDAEGRWSWPWISEKRISLSFSKSGYGKLDNKAFLPSDQEYVVTLKRRR
jgi:hypothetical protein